LLGHPGLGIRRRRVGGVRAPLAAEVHRGIAGIIGRRSGCRLGFEALVAGPRLDQGAIGHLAFAGLAKTATHPARQSGKALLAASGTNTLVLWALTATECVVPAGCSVLLFPVPTAGALNAGTS